MFAQTLIALISIFGLQALSVAQQPEQPVLRNHLPVAKYVGPARYAPKKNNAETFGVEVSAKAAVVMDVQSGQVLFEKNADQAMPIASLTKLITAMTLLDMHPDLQSDVQYSPADRGRVGRVYVDLNDRFTTQKALELMLVGSSNESAHALARTYGGDDFIAAMNAKAKTLGMTHAVFYDPSGLNPNNEASAKDVAIALRAALSYPEIRKITEMSRVEATGEATGRSYLLHSTNLLLASSLNKEPYHVIAGKTGSLDEAGFCFAQGTINQDGNEVIAVVLNSNNHFARFQDVKALTYWAFSNFEWPKSIVKAADRP